MRKKDLPKEIQKQIAAIDAVKPELSRVKIPDHPDLASLDQFIVIHGVVISLKNNYLKLNYAREFVSKKTKKVISIQKESPEWVIGGSDQTVFLDKNFKPVMVENEHIIIDYDEQGNEVEKTEIKKEPLKVNTIKYLTFLEQNNLIGFVQLIEHYAQDFVKTNETLLNQ